MKTAWKSLIVAGAVLIILSGQVMAQPWGGGPGRGQGMGWRPQGPGPMGARPMRPGGPQGPGGAWCPFGIGPGGRGAWTPGGPGQGLFPGVLLRRLNLTEEQIDKIRDILEDARSKAEEARDAVVDAREAMEDAVAKGVDAGQIRDAADKLGKAIADEAVRRAEALASVKKVLTQEQVKQLEQMKERIGQFRQGNRNRPFGNAFGGPGGRGPQGGRGPGGQMGPGFGRGQQGFGPADPSGRGPSGQSFRGGPGAGQGRGYRQW